MIDDFTVNVKLSSLALNLRRLRKERGETVKQIASRLGTTVSKVVRWETDKETPPVDKIALLAEIYGVSQEEIWK